MLAFSAQHKHSKVANTCLHVVEGRIADAPCLHALDLLCFSFLGLPANTVVQLVRHLIDGKITDSFVLHWLDLLSFLR